MAESIVSPAQGNQSQVKLRLSCDRCSSNKVKCSQERPECQRCRSLDLPCHYSRSLRMGKPPRSRQRSSKNCCHHDHRNASNISLMRPALSENAPSSAAVLANTPLEDLLMSQDSDLTGGVVQAWPDELDYESILNNIELPLDSISPRISDPLVDSETIGQNHNQSHLSASPGPVYDISKQQTHSMSMVLPSTLNNAVCERLTPRSMTAFPLSATENGLDNQHAVGTSIPARSGQVSSSAHRCVRQAMDALDSLYRIFLTENSTDYEFGTPRVDEILQVNSEAMEVVATLLACPCIKDFCLQIILAVISCKILVGYQAVVNIRDPQIQIPAGETTLCRPIAVGAYTLDESASQMVIIQIVLAKLRELSKLIQAFINSFCFDASSNRQGQCGLVYRTIGLFLQNRLNTTTDGLRKRLSVLVGEVPEMD